MYLIHVTAGSNNVRSKRKFQIKVWFMSEAAWINVIALFAFNVAWHTNRQQWSCVFMCIRLMSWLSLVKRKYYLALSAISHANGYQISYFVVFIHVKSTFSDECNPCWICRCVHVFYSDFLHMYKGVWYTKMWLVLSWIQKSARWGEHGMHAKQYLISQRAGS